MENPLSATATLPSMKRQRRRKPGWDLDKPEPWVSIDSIEANNEASSLLLKQQQEAARLIEQMAVQQKAQAMQAAATRDMACRIYVGSINYDLKESDIVTLFSTFGTVTKSEMSMDPMTGRSKGFCFIEFADVNSAEAAMAMDGFELAGRKIKVGKPHHTGGGLAAAVAPNPGIANILGAVTGQLQAGIPGLQMGGMHGAGSMNLPAAGPAPSGLPPQQQTGVLPQSSVGTNVPPLPSADPLNTIFISNIQDGIGDTEIRAVFAAFGAIENCVVVVGPNGGTVATVQFPDASLAASVAASMQGFDLAGMKLSCQLRSAGAAATQLEQQKQQAVLGAAVPSGATGASLCSVLLQNMVTIEDTHDPELKDEIAEEARTFGALTGVDIVVVPSDAGPGDSSDAGPVNVILRYADAVGARNACQAMHGRVFAGNKISASLLP